MRQWRAGGPYGGGPPGNPGTQARPLSCRNGGVTGRTGPYHANGGKPTALPGVRAVYGGCQSHFPNSPMLCLSMLSLTAWNIVRAKRHLLGQLGDGRPHPTGTLIASVATLLGAERLGRPQIALPSRDSVKTDHHR